MTGAASGIGAAVARRLLAEGAAVLAADADARGLPRLATAGAETLACDVTSAVDRRRLVEAAGRVDCLVNSAGVIRLVPLGDVTEELWDHTMAVNAKATFFLMQAFARSLAPGSAIVNLSSTAGKAASTIEASVYSCSKAAVIAMTKTFAYALAPTGIRVNCVCPGIVDTPMQDAVLAELAEARGATVEALDAARVATVPLGRPASPDEAAAVICFLLSSDASYMTGQAVNVSGGLVTY